MFEVYPEINKIVSTILIFGVALSFVFAAFMTIYRLEKDDNRHKKSRIHKLKKA
jgi:hypothetical protein